MYMCVCKYICIYKGICVCVCAYIYVYIYFFVASVDFN